MASDNDDDGTNSKDTKIVEIGIGEALTMLDRLVNLKYLSKKERNSLVAIKDKLEKIRVLNKKQCCTNDWNKVCMMIWLDDISF